MVRQRLRPGVAVQPHPGNAGGAPDRDLRSPVLPDDVGVHRPRLNPELFREQPAQPRRVDERARPDHLARRQAGGLLRDLRQDVHRVGRHDEDAGEPFSLEPAHDVADDAHVLGQEIEPGHLRAAGRLACGDDNDRASRRLGVVAMDDLDRRRHRHRNGVLEIHHFAFGRLRIAADQDELPDEAALDQGIGAGHPDRAAADDADTVLMGRRG